MGKQYAFTGGRPSSGLGGGTLYYLIRYKRCFIIVYNPKRGQGVPPPLWGAASGGRADGSGVPMRCVLKKPFMLSGCVGFPNKAFPPPDLCSPKRGAACPTGALHNRRGAGLRDRVRAAAYAVCRRRFAARRHGLAERKDVFAVCRGFRGFRKVVLRALTPARPVWRAPFPARSATGNIANPARCAGVGKCVLRARRCGKIAKRTARSYRAAFAAGRSAAFALALVSFVYWPESTSASRQPLSAADAESRQKETFRPCGADLRDGCGRLTEVYGIRAPTADMVCGAL